MVLKFVLLTLVICTSAVSANQNGIFNNERCKTALAEIELTRGDAYIQEAIDKGIPEPLRNEYYERRKRERYLAEQYDSAANEYRFSDEMLERAVSFVRQLPRAEAPLRAEAVREFVRRTGSVWGEDERTAKEHFPMFYAIIDAKPPRMDAHCQSIKRIISMKLIMAGERAAFSINLVKLPLDHTVSQLPKSVLNQAMASGRDLVEADMKRVAGTFFGFYFKAKATDKKSTSEKASSSLIEQCLRSPQVPSEIKNEIHQQLDFQSKYGFPNSPAFDCFLREAVDYFNVHTE